MFPGRRRLAYTIKPIVTRQDLDIQLRKLNPVVAQRPLGDDSWDVVHKDPRQWGRQQGGGLSRGRTANDKVPLVRSQSPTLEQESPPLARVRSQSPPLEQESPPLARVRSPSSLLARKAPPLPSSSFTGAALQGGAALEQSPTHPTAPPPTAYKPYKPHTPLGKGGASLNKGGGASLNKGGGASINRSGMVEEIKRLKSLKKSNKIEESLRRLGFTSQPGKGSHFKWMYKGKGRHLSIPQHYEVSDGVSRYIYRTIQSIFYDLELLTEADFAGELAIMDLV